MNLYNQFQLLRAQVDGLNEGIEPRKLLPFLVLVFATGLTVLQTVGSYSGFLSQSFIMCMMQFWGLFLDWLMSTNKMQLFI